MLINFCSTMSWGCRKIIAFSVESYIVNDASVNAVVHCLANAIAGSINHVGRSCKLGPCAEDDLEEMPEPGMVLGTLCKLVACREQNRQSILSSEVDVVLASRTHDSSTLFALSCFFFSWLPAVILSMVSWRPRRRE